MAIQIPNLDRIRTLSDKNPAKWVYVFEALQALAANAPNLSIPSPPAVKSINAVGQDGIVHVTLQDSGPVQNSVNYFAEYDTDPNFSNPHVVPMGTSREWRGMIGNQTAYWRAYSQYDVPPGYHSPPNAPIIFGAAVSPGGVAGPALPTSTGSGTASTTGQQGGHGFGKTIVRPVNG